MPLSDSRDRLARLLQENDLKVVFSESCTGGLVAATLAQVSGISNCLCGSAVTYRPATKGSWLGISQGTMDRHTCESQAVSEAMVTAVLAKTAEANWAAAVVGHFEPPEGAPFVWVSLARRIDSGSADSGIEFVASQEQSLAASSRVEMQVEAARLVLDHLAKAIQASL